MRSEYKVAIIGILGIVLLEGFALYQGIDGIAMASAFAGIGAIVGYVIKSIKRTSK